MHMFRRILSAALFLILALQTAAFAEEGEFRPLPMDLSVGAPYDAEYASDLLVYEDPTIRVERTLRTTNKDLRIEYYAVDIRLQDGSQIRTAHADPTTFLSERVLEAHVIARRVNAVFAMNGDFCGDFHGNESSKYIFRQGTLYRDTVDRRLDMLIIDEAGDLHIIPATEDLEALDKTQVDGKKVCNVLQFGPGLVIDGKPVEDEYLLDENHSPQFASPAGNAPRVGLVQLGPLHYLAVCTRNYANLAEFKQLILALAPDCRNAYVLDGGGSAQFVFLGQRYNNISKSSQKSRSLSDILYFASAWFGKGE